MCGRTVRKLKQPKGNHVRDNAVVCKGIERRKHCPKRAYCGQTMKGPKPLNAAVYEGAVDANAAQEAVMCKETAKANVTR